MNSSTKHATAKTGLFADDKHGSDGLFAEVGANVPSNCQQTQSLPQATTTTCLYSMKTAVFVLRSLYHSQVNYRLDAVVA